MPKSKTSSFYMTEIAQFAAASSDGDRVTVEVDLGAYVDVGSQTALAVEQVDVIWQAGSSDPNSFVSNMIATDGALGYQLTDNNPSNSFIFANDRSLIASGSMNACIEFVGTTGINAFVTADFYPDSYGKLDESRLVVADKMYFTIGVDGTDIGAFLTSATLRLKARLVKLDSKDWMAIAITSVSQE